jgi:hypothetical protein
VTTQEENGLQDIANKVNLGKHQHLISATDEEGRLGRWIVHRPNMKDEIKIGVLYSQLRTADNDVHPLEIEGMRDNLSFMVATLTVVVDMRPDWFPSDVGECLDSELVVELFTKYCEWKECFRRPVSGELREDSSTPQSTDPGASV